MKLPYVFVRDNAFSLSENIKKPYKGSKPTNDQRIFTTVAVELDEPQEMHLEFLQPGSDSFRKPFSYSLKMLGISYSPIVIYTTT